MNDLEYRRKQLFKLQETVIDLEDLSTGVSIADLTLTNFRIDLAEYLKSSSEAIESQPLGSFAVTTSSEADIPPGIIFCLRAEGNMAKRKTEPGYPLAPYYLVHVNNEGAVLLPHAQVKSILDRLKRLCSAHESPDFDACKRFDKATKQGEDMRSAQRLLATAVASIIGKSEERALASLFSPGGTHVLNGEFFGVNDFEVIAYLVILPNDQI
jgi:hypothetical protein